MNLKMNPINNSAQLTTLVSLFAAQLPILLVSALACLVVGVRRHELSTASLWAFMGFGLSVLLCILIPVAQTLVQNWVMNSGQNVAQRASVFTILAVVWSLLRAVSYASLLMAVVGGRTASRNV
jgi:glucan phosphoethanolaminetransferase (alkaline phosphatase superfamily)